MASAFDAEFASEVVPDLLDVFGQSVIASRNSATVTLTMILETQQVETRESRDVMSTRTMAVLTVAVSAYNFGSGLTTPSPIDEFLIGSRRFEATSKDVNGLGKCWDYTDGTSTMFKIFVEEVKA